jgi:hypothetical protein
MEHDASNHSTAVEDHIIHLNRQCRSSAWSSRGSIHSFSQFENVRHLIGLCSESFDTYISGASLGENKSGEKFLTWDIWVAAAIAVAAVVVILIFDLQPLLIIVILLALGGYIAAYTMIDRRNDF